MPTHRLSRLQRYLERIYEVDVTCDVGHFVITDPELAEALERGSPRRNVPEKLLVCEQEDGLYLSLYLDPAVVEVLAANDPIRSLNDGNLAEFWTVLEGVSHFLYLAWNAHHGRGVSLFELELQAEVDKFVATVFLLALQRDSHVPREIHEQLFSAPAFDANLRGHELHRYRDANRFAGLYCGQLHRQYLLNRGAGLVKDLRRFYRLTHRYKLDHIRALATA